MRSSSFDNDDAAMMMPDPNNIRDWFTATNHPKHLQILDKFEMELKLGRLTTENNNGMFGATDRLGLTFRTVELLKVLIGSTRWKNAAQLIFLLRGLGRELHAVGGFREPAMGNVVRRVMAAVREEVYSSKATATSATASATSSRPSMQSILWANPQKHQPPTRLDSSSSAIDHSDEGELPPIFYQDRPDFKQTIMEAIQEIMLDLEDTHKNIDEQALSYIHADEVVLTYGKSTTVENFLKAAAAKKRNFQVVVCEGAPHMGGIEMAKSLSKAGIDTIVINDSATFAVMARVNKVLLPAHAVLANGGLIASSGCNMVALAASNMAVPVVCLTGMFKLCPMFPHEGQDTLQDMVSPSSMLKLLNSHGDGGEQSIMSDPLMKGVQFLNPVNDYIAPELLNLYVTNVGAFQPSYIYRLLAENYHSDDWESFE
jgi:translation initiation factor eIF-2B subunit beta